MIDLSKIAPLTEAEADVIFGGPSTREKYDAAMAKLSEQTFPDMAQVHESIERYVALIMQRLREAREAQHRAESRINAIRENY